MKEADPCKRATHERATHGAKVSNTNAKHIFKNVYSTKDTLGQLNTSIIQV